jgi:small subunit ribosomal protein S34
VVAGARGDAATRATPHDDDATAHDDDATDAMPTHATREAAKATLARLMRARPNLYELSSARGDRGIGRAFTKHSWRARPDRYPETYWTLTRIRVRPSGRSGEAWGRLTWKGRARAEESRINGSVKPIWAELRRDDDAGEDARGGPRLTPPAMMDDARAM